VKSMLRRSLLVVGCAGWVAAQAAAPVDLSPAKWPAEERARYELGMVRQDEVFFQVVQEPAARPRPPQ